MVDYRTSRIKAMQERVDALTIGGGLSLFLQGVTNNGRGGDSADGSYSADLFFPSPDRKVRKRLHKRHGGARQRGADCACHIFRA